MGFSPVTYAAAKKVAEDALTGAGALKGQKGDPGANGKDGANGKSAYEIAVADGFTGTEKEWLASLVGPKGDTGATGEAGPKGQTGSTGEKGATGATGRSAYEIAVANGFTGTEAEWLASLKGEKGDTGSQGPKGDTGSTGATGSKGDTGETGATGEAGKAATIAIGKVTTLEEGKEATVVNSGTENAAVLDIGIPIGKTGENGKDATEDVVRTTESHITDSVAGNIVVRDWTKNLLPYPYAQTTLTSNGVTFTDSKDGRITASGTATDNVFFNFIHMSAALVLKAGTTYTLSGVKGVFVSIRSYASDGTTEQEHFDIESGVGSLTFTPTVDSAYITIYIYVASGATVSAIVRPMLEIGDVAHGYVPFAGYEIRACGKNIVNSPTNSQTYKGVTIAPSDNGFTLTGTAEDLIWMKLYSDQQGKFINVADKVGKKIILSIDNSLKGTDYLYSIFVDKDGNNLIPWLIVGQDENTKRNTLTVPATAVKLSYPMVRLQNESGTYSGESYHYQIEFGDNATEITPYEDLGKFTVSNDTSTPVYGLKAADGVTNILTDYGAEITVDYPKTVNGQYALSNAEDLKTSIDGFNSSLTSLTPDGTVDLYVTFGTNKNAGSYFISNAVYVGKNRTITLNSLKLLDGTVESSAQSVYVNGFYGVAAYGVSGLTCIANITIS